MFANLFGTVDKIRKCGRLIAFIGRGKPFNSLLLASSPTALHLGTEQKHVYFQDSMFSFYLIINIKTNIIKNSIMIYGGLTLSSAFVLGDGGCKSIEIVQRLIDKYLEVAGMVGVQQTELIELTAQCQYTVTQRGG